MSLLWTGALLGLLAAIGLGTAVRASPPLRPIRLEARLAPYVADTPVPSRLLADGSTTGSSLLVVRRLLGPVLADLVRLVDRMVGGSTSVRRRLRGLGGDTTVEAFRMEQVVWGVLGLVGGGIGVTALTWVRGAPDPVLAGGGALFGAVLGVLGRDWWLSRELRLREEAMLSEFPVVADLLALAVVAGEAPVDAITRVCRLTNGHLASELGSAVAQSRAGIPMTRALSDVADRTTFEPFARFLDGFVVAIERGTPLADVLRAQAADVREIGKRALLEVGGKKEISMMAPVVFLILPVTVLFALYPGLLTLVSLTQ
ncbi:MAG: type II secretion system F family protein [bacterium]